MITVQPMFQRTFLRQVTRWLLTILIVGGVAGGSYFVWQRYSIPKVTVTEVAEGPVVQAFYATGTLLPHREYPVKANVEGTLEEVLVDKGTEVQKGQTVAKVYVEEFLLKRAQAEADLDLKKQLSVPDTSPVLLEFDAKIHSAEKQLETAKRELVRLNQISNPSARTQSDVDRAEENSRTFFNAIEALKSAKQAKILEFARDLKTAQAQLDIANWNISQQSITSPIDGVVLDWPVSTGTRVKVNDMLMTVANVHYDKLVMRTNVDEEDKTRVALDQVVQLTLYSYPGRVFEGRVKRIYPKADTSRRTFEVDVQIMSPDAAFSAGMTGELAFVVARKEQAIVVPSQSVQSGEVWIVRDKKLAKADVELGLKSIQRTEIVSGLQPGDSVVVSPIGKLPPGQEVVTTHIDPDVAAGLNEVKTQATNAFKGMK
jgi:RND family efflux transporter MFP subunit